MAYNEIWVADKELKRALRKLGSEAGVALSRASNRAATAANTEIKKRAAAVFIVRQGDIQKALSTRKATAAKPQASLRYSSKKKNLYEWEAGGSRAVSPQAIVKGGRPRPNPNVYKASIRRGKRVAFDRGPKAFVQRMPKNGGVIFVRRKNNFSRSKLESIQAAALSQLLSSRDVIDPATKRANEIFQKRLAAEIDYLLKS